MVLGIVATTAALGFAAHNACTPSKTQWYDTLSALLVACLALQLSPAWAAALVLPPLLSAVLGQGWQLVAGAHFASRANMSLEAPVMGST